MPCHYYMPGEEEEIARRELDKVTRMLCGLMKGVDRANGLALALSPELRAWWDDHKRKDAEREAADRRFKIETGETRKREIADLEAKLAKMKAELA